MMLKKDHKNTLTKLNKTNAKILPLRVGVSAKTGDPYIYGP